MRLLFCGLLLAITVLHASGMTLEECKAGAAAGDAEALWQLGQRYENGEGVRKDGLKAVTQYRKAADKKHAKACARLAEFYEKGKIVGKDAVLAAKYRAIAQGESVELATAFVRQDQENAKVDEIEIALDYIIGRNGKKRDAKTGVRLLYQVGKENPTAQRVFIERWEKSDLDDGLNALDDNEWDLIIPWFKSEYDRGRHRCGLVLGIEAYREKDFGRACGYWRRAGESGSARAWRLLGDLHWVDGKDDGVPECLHSPAKALNAYQHCLRLDKTCDEARRQIGAIYLFGGKSVENCKKSLEIFSSMIKESPNDEVIMYCYGMAGIGVVMDEFYSRWPESRVDYLFRQHDYWSRQSHRLETSKTRTDEKMYENMVRDYKEMQRRRDLYLVYIRRAASSGYSPAVNFIEKINKGAN